MKNVSFILLKKLNGPFGQPDIYIKSYSLLSNVLGWPKGPFRFFHKIKDTFFIFTNNFIDLDILSMSAISCVV